MLCRARLGRPILTGSIIALLAALAIEATIRLEAIGSTAARLFDLFRRGLQPLQFRGRLDEVFGKRSRIDFLARKPLDVAQQSALLR